MPIYDSSKDYGSGQILILWDGNRPSDEEFLDHAKNNYGGNNKLLTVEEPTYFRGQVHGMKNPGTAVVVPHTHN